MSQIDVANQDLHSPGDGDVVALQGTVHIRRVFFFNDTVYTEIYTLSLHDALPIPLVDPLAQEKEALRARMRAVRGAIPPERSEEHTSELQSRVELGCRLLPEKKNKRNTRFTNLKECRKKYIDNNKDLA